MFTQSLKNKIIIVTGGSGGIGNAIVNRLARNESLVVSVYNKNLPGDTVSDKVFWIKADLTQSDKWDRLISFTISKFGRIDVLINNCGFLEPGEFSSLEELQFRKMIDLNLTSVLIGTHKTLSIMKNQKSGHIINIGSLGGIIPMPYSAVYSATKFALRGFSLSIAQEYKGTNIKISLLTSDSVVGKMLDKESENSRPTISFYNNPLIPELIATEIAKMIDKPKVEKIIKGNNKIPAIVLGSFPNLFQFVYPFIEKMSDKKRKKYMKLRRIKIK